MAVQSIGVCYGMLGDNLPQPSSVVNLYKSKGIGAMRIYSPDTATLQALKGSNIKLILGVPNDKLQSFASDQSAAANWVKSNVQAYIPGVSFKYIAVGNEVIPGNQAQYVLPAIQNIYNALSSAGLSGQIKVSTSVSQGVLGSSYPPSNGAFSSDAASTLGPIVQFLAKTGAPLLVNVYPYFSYVDNQGSININYALFTSPGIVVQDGQYGYQNLFDAIVDALYAEGRGFECQYCGVRERLAVGRWHRSHSQQCTDIQSEADQPCGKRDAEEARADRNLHICNVQ